MSKKPKRVLKPHERVLTPNQAATLEQMKGAVVRAEKLRENAAADMARARLDRYVLAIATGFYAVSDSRPSVGPQDYPENPRATPELTNAAIVDAALDLMKQVDAEVAGEAPSQSPADAARPPLSPTSPDSPPDAPTEPESAPLAAVVAPYGRVVTVEPDATRQGASYRKGLEEAAKVADRNDQSAWGIAREIRQLATEPEEDLS